ncbi:hypothetical protein SAMN02910456_01186 [Ruminococcaceae bacterium YRB3002]|nr:hypothetical protein SAMN02910456_01186 [Ruminococcaceae bacterium YRB3002]
MHRIRKLISILLCVSILFGIVTGCSWFSDEKSEGSVSMETAFSDGWNTAVEFLGSEAAATGTSEYIAEVENAISAFKDLINQSAGSNRGIPQEAGFVAEKWVAGTFNIDSALNESLYSAKVVGSTDLGSPDVVVETNNEVIQEASLKYYNSGSRSASAQATTILQAYQDYRNNTTAETPLDFQQYCEQNGYSSDTSELLPLYEGQTRIIPSDQIDDAIKYLKHQTDSVDDAYAETLNALRSRLESPDGTSSEPATYEQMQAVAELAKTGEFDPEDFGFSISQIITPKHVVKQAIKGGLTAATVNTVMQIGPDLFSVIREGLRTGQLDITQLRDVGIDGFLASATGFVEGAASSLLVSACQSGKLGTSFASATPEQVGAIVVITIQSIRYGYALSKGEITALEYGDLMAENVVVVIGSVAGGVALQSLLPGFPLSYMIGSFVGGILASLGFNILKGLVNRIIMYFKGAGGFEVALPTTELVENVTAIPYEIVEKSDVFYKLSSAQDISINVEKEGAICIGLDAEFFCTNCGAVLNDMPGFNPDLNYFFCEDCGTLLYGDDIYDGERFPGVIWFCDECDDCLSLQDGFSDLNDKWICEHCGYENSITEDDID